MANSGLNFFDKLCECFGNCMTMEQIAKFALTSKVILSYKIDFLSSFHDQLMKGLWKRSSNGCIYPLDNRFEKILYVEINEDYEVNLEKSLEKLRKLSNNTVAQKVFDEVCEPNPCVSPVAELVCDAPKVFDELSEPNLCFVDVPIVEVSIAHKVFDKMSKPLLSSSQSQFESRENDNALKCDLDESKELQVDDDCPAQKFHLGNEGNGVIECACVCDRIDEIQAPNCLFIDENTIGYGNKDVEINSKYLETKVGVVDEVSIILDYEHESNLQFIKEMAQAASIVEENISVSEIKADAKGFEYPHSHSLQAPILKAAIAYEGANIIRQQDDLSAHIDHEKFSALDHSSLTYLVDIFSTARLFVPPPLIVKAGLLLEVALHAESLISGCSLSQVTTNPFLSFVGLENAMSCWGVVNVDHDNLLCSMILEPTCRYQFAIVDPGFLFLLSRMAEKDPCLSFFDFKIGLKAKINYKEVHSWGKLCTTLGWGEGLWSTIWPLHFQCDHVMSSQRVDYISEAVRLYPSKLRKPVLFVGIALMFHAFELLLVLIDFEEQLTKKWLQILFKSQYSPFLEIMTTCSNIRWIKLALSCSFSLTLEGKGDFRGEEDTSEECSSGTNQSVIFYTYIIDPGGLYINCAMWNGHPHNYWNPLVVFNMSLLVCKGRSATVIYYKESSRYIMCHVYELGHGQRKILVNVLAVTFNGSEKSALVICCMRFIWKRIIVATIWLVFDPGGYRNWAEKREQHQVFYNVIPLRLQLKSLVSSANKHSKVFVVTAITTAEYSQLSVVPSILRRLTFAMAQDSYHGQLLTIATHPPVCSKSSETSAKRKAKALCTQTFMAPLLINSAPAKSRVPLSPLFRNAKMYDDYQIFIFQEGHR